jgi:hypothetical protein
MQTPEEFMREYLAAKVAEAAREVEAHQPFRRKFYTDDCFFDSRAKTVGMHQSEKVDSTSNSEKDVTVITHMTAPFAVERHLRYHLKPNGQTWLIENVDSECAMCSFRKSIDPNCPMCGGTSWTDRKMRERLMASRDKKKNDPPCDDNSRFEL